MFKIVNLPASCSRVLINIKSIFAPSIRFNYLLSYCNGKRNPACSSHQDIYITLLNISAYQYNHVLPFYLDIGI